MVCPPLRWCWVQGACSVPCFCSPHPVFAPGSSKLAVGFFWSLCIFCPEFAPNYHAVIFSPIQFLCILLLEERCVQVQALQHCSKGPQVPACLKPSSAVVWSNALNSHYLSRSGILNLGTGVWAP